jgi:hypothetical protein
MKFNLLTSVSALALAGTAAMAAPLGGEMK